MVRSDRHEIGNETAKRPLRLLQRTLTLMLLTLLPVFICGHLHASIDITPETLFSEMETRTEQIFSLVAELELASGSAGIFTTLSIQSPDKFSMDFRDNSLRVVFDGSRLWIYIGSIAEVFYLDTRESGGWAAESLKSWVNPKKIVSNITRHTLFTLFDISITGKRHVQATSEMNTHEEYVIRFTPRGKNVFKRLFNVGYYEMVFSTKNFLPSQVCEYSPEGKVRGVLTVRKYTINRTLPKEKFIFEVPPGVKQIHMSVVIAQKLEESKDMLVESIGKLLQKLREKMLDWGI